LSELLPAAGEPDGGVPNTTVAEGPGLTVPTTTEGNGVSGGAV